MFLVYEHWRPDTNVCFYVGKGKLRRAHALYAKCRSVRHNNVVQKLARAGLNVDVRIVQDGLSEDDAFALEKERIAFWRAAGTSLVNLTDGGEGPSGWKMSAEHAAKLLAINSNRIVPQEMRETIRNKLIGHPVSKECRAKISAANTGRSPSPEVREKLRAAQKAVMADPARRKAVSISSTGRKHSPETLKRFSEIHKGKVVSEEVREKLRVANLGKKTSPETKVKLSQAMLAYRANQRAVAATVALPNIPTKS